MSHTTPEKQGSSGGVDDGPQTWRGRVTKLAKQSWPRTKLLAPPVVGALLITPFVLVKVLENWMSPNPFFAYIHFFLFFFPSPLAAGAYLERSIITLLFVAVGTGLSFLALCGCIWIDGEGAPAYSSPKSRAIGVITLIFFCFSTGTLSSYAPRLKGPCRALLFGIIWELTKQYNVISARIFLDNFYPALVAMVVGVICNIAVFPRTARRTSVSQLCDLFDGTQRLMQQAIEDFFVDLSTPRNERRIDHLEVSGYSIAQSHIPKFKKLKVDAEALQTRLESNLDAARYELAFARVPIGLLGIFLPILRDIRAWYSCSLTCLTDESANASSRWTAIRSEHPSATSGSSPDLGSRGPSESGTRPALDFQGEITNFSIEIQSSLECLRQCVRKCHGSDLLTTRLSAFITGKKHSEQFAVMDDPVSAITQQKEKLRDSIRHFKAALNDAMKESRSEVIGKTADESATTTGVTPDSGAALGADLAAKGQLKPVEETLALAHLFRNEAYQISFLMIAMLEVALLIDSCLSGALMIATAWQNHPRRSLSMPIAKWKYWLERNIVGADDQMALVEERIDALLHEDEPSSPISEGEFDDMDFFDDGSEILLGPAALDLERITSRVSVATAHNWIRRKLRAFRLTFWSRKALHVRIALSNQVRSLRHSRHIKFGFKLAAGMVLLTLPSWLAPGESRQWWVQNRGQWMAISYLFCLETSTGASIRTSFFRILGTISGAILGLIINEIAQDNPYALAFLLTVATALPSYVMLFTKIQGVGIVMSLTVPIVALIPTEDKTETPIYVAWNRGYMIFFGIVAALAVNLFFWPLHARVELVKRVSSITAQLQSLYLSLSRQMLSGGLISSHKSSAAFERLEVGIESRICQARGLVDVMTAEISLKPKRTKVLSELLNHLEIILELLMGLRRCREHGLRSVRQHAVVNVLELRQSLIASVLLVLWTTGQALQTKAPLPQCLPSPRLALEELTEAVAEQLRMMVEGSEPPHRIHRKHGVPDAYHALDSLNKGSILANVRQRNRKRPGLHSIQTGSPVSGAISGSVTPTRDHARRAAAAALPSDPETPTTKGKRSLDYAFFFILAEHALLEQIVTSLEQLSELCRSMVGESSFIRTEFVSHNHHHLSSHVGGLGTPNGAVTPALGHSRTRDATTTTNTNGEGDTPHVHYPSMPRSPLAPEHAVTHDRLSGRSGSVPDVGSRRIRDPSPLSRHL